MPSPTTRGYPYPPLTGVTADVPRDMQALAEAVDTDVSDHEAAKTGVHGIPAMANGQGLVWNGTTWVATDVATQAELDAVAAARLAAPTGAPALFDNTNRFVSTNYQPHATRPVLVVAAFTGPWGSYLDLRIGAAITPVTSVCLVFTSSGSGVSGGTSALTLVGLVPPNWFYRVHSGGGVWNLQSWVEYTL